MAQFSLLENSESRKNEKKRVRQKSKDLQMKTKQRQQQFLLSFFNDEPKYQTKKVNGFVLVKRFNKHSSKWQVAIYTPDSFKQYQSPAKKTPTVKKKHVKNLTEIYTDAGYSTKKKRGWLSVKNQKIKITEVSVPRIKGLKQYSNLLELQGVLNAMKSTTSKNVIIYTDSRVAIVWFYRTSNNLDRFSKYHYKTKEEIEQEKKRFDSIEVEWVSRDENPAGIALEKRCKV